MLKVMMLRKKIDDKKKQLDQLRAKDEEFAKREADLATAIGEAETDEEKETVETMIGEFETEHAAHEDAKGTIEREISELEHQLEEEEAAQEAPAAAPAPEAVPEERKDKKVMITRNKFFSAMSVAERTAMFEREDVKEFLQTTRESISQKRAVTNVGLLIPEVLVEVLRANVLEYSKLYKHVAVRPVSGDARIVIQGTVPEAVWTDCCGTLNELDLAFNDLEFGCWKVGGYYAICNAAIEDSDIDLAAEILEALGQAIGLALDKAILFGTGTRMPLGAITRIAQTSKPADYPDTARTWVDLHTTNITKINGATMTGLQLFQELVKAAGATSNPYGRGERVWIMNDKTYSAILSASMGVDAAGAIVAGTNGRMPAIGGVIEVLPFIADNDIVAGFFDLYKLVERAGNKFATSEHVRFIQDQTVFKGTARYDGAPAIAEAFMITNIANTDPTTTVTFAPDTANSESN